MPNPTWGNHPQICNTLNIPHKKYRYYDAKTHGFDLNGALEDICVSISIGQMEENVVN